MWKKLVNKILHKFGYHLVRNPRPYQRKKESFKKEEDNAEEKIKRRTQWKEMNLD
jgi:hypothetical protein